VATAQVPFDPGKTKSKNWHEAAAKSAAQHGGPENPLADVKALRAARKAKKGAGAGGSGKGPGKAKGSSTALMAEMLICFAVLGAGTVLAPQGPQSGVPRLIAKGTGLALVFFILSLLSAGGQGPKKFASGVGGLVTLSYLVLSQDGTNIFKWMYSYFTPPPVFAGAVPQGEREMGAGYGAGSGETYVEVPVGG
jgi:hypothetical protein